MLIDFNKINKVEGVLKLPGDKSISHRAVIFAALAKGESGIYNLSNGEDVKSTLNCFENLGIEIIHHENYLSVVGNGYKGLKKPLQPLNAGNSGTTTRLLSGILIAQNFELTITGDSSLSKRPMKRIIMPLEAMGGKISASDVFTLPIKIFPTGQIIAINYELPIASAQVKSAVLLAGLHSEQITSVIEKFPSRDHTEKMLGLKTEFKNFRKISYVSQKDYPQPKEYFIPSDISTAAFFIVLTLLSKNSSLQIKNVSLNKTRTGILEILKSMGGEIEVEKEKEISGEISGDILITSSILHNITLPENLIPNIIDEIPILSIAGIFAEGEFKLENAAELRGKETDRIAAICFNFKKLGLDVHEFSDGFFVKGGIKNNVPVFESFNDHRIAMAFGILSLLLNDGGKVNNFECVNISNANFMNQLYNIVR